MRLVFAGTPEAALPALRALVNSRHTVAAVVTRPAARSVVPRSPARDRTRLLPGGGLRRAAAAVGPRHPRPRLGEPALLGAAGVARRRPGAARGAGRR